MSGHEPKPRSAERLHLKSIDYAGIRPGEGVVTVTASFTYEPWCCDGSHEIIDGAKTLRNAVELAIDAAYKKRMAKLQAEHEELVKELLETDE